MLDLTPQTFVELIVLGVYWEHWPRKLVEYVNHKGTPVHTYAPGFTTVDHVMKIYKWAKVLDDAYIKRVHHRSVGVAYQRKLLRHCGVSYGGEYVTNNDSWLLCQSGNNRGAAIELPRLVRTQRIVLLEKGVNLAPMFETKHAGLLTKEGYLTAAKEFVAQFPNDVARLAALKRYRGKTEQALDQD